jgi:3-oxoacyl-[acyl-carrier-protein] synthase-3
MYLSLKSVNSYIPPTIKKLGDHYADFGMSAKDAQIFNRFYGVDAIPVSDESSLALMLKAAKPLVENLTSSQKKLIKYIIVPRTTVSLDLFGVSSVQRLAHQLSLSHAIAFSTGMNKCASLLRAFEMSHNLLRNEKKGTMVLIVVGEPIFTNETRLLPSISISGDASGAALVTLNKTSNHQLKASHMTTLGEYAEGSWMSPKKVATFGKLFEPVMLQTAEKALEKAQLSWNDIRLVLPHNVNIPCWRGFARFAKVPLEKFYLKNISRTSHCFNADWLINWTSMMEENCIQKGEYYMMATVAVGAVFAVGIFKY